MKKLVAVVGQKPEIEPLVDQLDELIRRTEERKEFFDRQIEVLKKETHEKKREIWNRLEARCLELGLLPAGYTPKQWALSYDADLGILTVTEITKGPAIPEFLRPFLP